MFDKDDDDFLDEIDKDDTDTHKALLFRILIASVAIIIGGGILILYLLLGGKKDPEQGETAGLNNTIQAEEDTYTSEAPVVTTEATPKVSSTPDTVSTSTATPEVTQAPSATATPAATSTPVVNATPKPTETVTAKEYTNLRTEPTTATDSNIVAQLKNGESITRIATRDDGWSELDYNGQTVYALTTNLTNNLSYTADSSTESTSDGLEFGMVFTPVNETVGAKMEVNLRSEPSTAKGNDTIVVRLPYGEYVTRVGIGDKGWSKIDYNGQIVYAVSSYIYVIENTTEE